MSVPFFFHIGNTGGLSFARAAADMRNAARILFINDAADLDRARPRLAPGAVDRIAFAFGHAIYLAEPWIADRYEMTMLRWPQAVFCANSIYAHEHPPYALPEIHGIADLHQRLRAYLDHLERGGEANLKTTAHWLAERHTLDAGPTPKRTEPIALVDPCDELLRDRYHLVAITELMDESLFLYQAAFPDRPVTPWVRRRENSQRVDPFDLPPDIVARFERTSAADVTLYLRARKRLLAQFTDLWRTRPDLRVRYLDYKASMILTDIVLMKRFAAADPLFFPPELPLEELRAAAVSRLDRAHEIRTNIMRAYG